MLYVLQHIISIHIYCNQTYNFYIILYIVEDFFFITTEPCDVTGMMASKGQPSQNSHLSDQRIGKKKSPQIDRCRYRFRYRYAIYIYIHTQTSMFVLEIDIEIEIEIDRDRNRDRQRQKQRQRWRQRQRQRQIEIDRDRQIETD